MRRDDTFRLKGRQQWAAWALAWCLAVGVMATFAGLAVLASFGTVQLARMIAP